MKRILIPSLFRSLNVVGQRTETQEKNHLQTMKKRYKKKMNQKYGDPYRICQNCKGNGYVRIVPYSETQTCKECGGAGHFEHEKITTKHEPDTIPTSYVLKLIKVLEEFIRGKKRTIH